MRHSLVLFSTAASLVMAAPTKFGVTGPRPWNKVVQEDLAPHALATRSLPQSDCLSILRNADPKILRELYKQSSLTRGDKQDQEVCQKLVARMTPRAHHEDDDEDDETCENPTATASPAPTKTPGGDDDDDCDAPEPTKTPGDDDDDCDDDDESDAGSDCSDDESDHGDDDDCSEDGDHSDDESDCDDDEPSPTGSEPAPTSTPTGDGGSGGGSCSKKYTVKAGDTCNAVAKKYGISLSDFYTWNPSLDSECQNLMIDKSYCVN